MKIIKVDLLGLGMMAVLEDCFNLVPQHYKSHSRWASFQGTTRRCIARCNAPIRRRMFQVGERRRCRHLAAQPSGHFYDLVVQVAIIRPEPIVAR